MSAWYKRKRKFSVQPMGANSDINVTPLVDVVLVLLIIFMVVTPLLEKDIEVRVPQTEEVETQVDVPKDQLVVEVTAEGQVNINDEQVPPERFQEALKQQMDRRRPGNKLAFFLADDKASYGLLVGLLDQAKLAGAETLGMMTEAPVDAAVPGAPAAPAPPPPTP